MRPNGFILICLLLASCAHSPAPPEPELVAALAAVRGDGPRVVRGPAAVRAHLRAQEQLSEARARALRSWCEGAPESPWTKSYCPAPEGEFQVISMATPVMPANVVQRSHEPGIDGGDSVLRMGDFVLVADQGSLTSIDVSGPAASPLQVADRMDYAPEATGDLNASVRLLAHSGQLVLCSYSGRDQRSGLFGLRLDGAGRMQQLWRMEFDRLNLCSKAQDRAYLHPDAVVASFLVDGDSSEPVQYRGADDSWQPLELQNEVYLTGQVASWPSLRVLLHCPLADLSAGSAHCTHRTVLSDGNEVLYLTTDSAYLLLAEAEDRLYLEPWMILGALAFPLDIRPDAESGGIEYPTSASKRQTWVVRVPLSDDSPIRMLRLRGWQFHPFPAVEVESDLHVLTRQQSARGQQTLALHRLGPSQFSGGDQRLHAPHLNLSLGRQQCLDQWMGEDWAWFAITDGHCGAATLERAGPESTRLQGIDLRSEREHRWPLAVRSWLIAPGGRLITVNHATRESLRLTLLPLDNPTRPQELELAEFSPAEALNGWDFGPAYSSDAESGRVVLNLAVMRQGNRVVADPDADPIPDLLLIEVEGAALHLLGATDLSSGSGWHPTLMESPWDHRRLLLTAERMLLVGSGELIELLARDGRLTSGARLSY